MKLTALLSAFLFIAMLGACKTSQPQAVATPVAAPQAKTGAQAALPRAIIYRCAPEYLDKVPVRLTPQGSLLSYPAPGDIPQNAAPVALADGWYISPVGIDKASAFTTYTYTAYRALPQAPAPADMLKAVIPGSQIRETAILPMTASRALADTAAVNKFINDSLQGHKFILKQ